MNSCGNYIKPMGQIFNEVYNNLTTLTDDQAFTQACAYVMSYFNTGLVLYRKEKNENKFTKIKTKLVPRNPVSGNIYAASNCL